jgi:membrane protein
MAQTSAALAFTTLLALVPLVTLVLSLASTIPFFDTLIHRLDAVLIENLLPAGAGGTIAGHVGKFAQKARQLTVPGIVMLGLTAFLLMHTIERAFNHLWHVKPRPLLARLRLYAFVMAVWPFILGALAGVISYAVTVSLGFVDEQVWVRRFVLKAVSMLLLGLFFAFLYYTVPNVRVTRLAAAVGGAFASLAFTAMQKGFELYLGSFGTFNNVYGAFAAVPIFLVWLQLSWAVVLIGGLIAATGFRPARR